MKVTLCLHRPIDEGKSITGIAKKLELKLIPNIKQSFSIYKWNLSSLKNCQSLKVHYLLAMISARSLSLN